MTQPAGPPPPLPSGPTGYPATTGGAPTPAMRRRQLREEIQLLEQWIASARVEVGRVIAGQFHGVVAPVAGQATVLAGPAGQPVVAEQALVAPRQPVPPAIATELAAIAAAEVEIARLNEAIEAIAAEAAAEAAAAAADTTPRCPACRNPILPDAMHCGSCGEDLGGRYAPPETTATNCIRCGTRIVAGTAFCVRCGWRIAVAKLPWWRSRWLRLLLSGIGLYLLTQIGVHLTSYNPTLIGAELLVGAFLVPVVFVVYFAERCSHDQLPFRVLAATFAMGGVLGCIAAAALENHVTFSGNWEFIPVGIFEEASKVLVVLWWLRRADLAGADRGMALGAAAGMGFAAMETMGGYALPQLLTDGGAHAMLTELNVRGLLAPLGHGSWTAIIVGFMWYEKSCGRPVFGRRVWVVYGIVALLHALYDISAGMTDTAIRIGGVPLPVPMLLLGAAGFATALWMVRWTRRRTHALVVIPAPVPPPPPLTISVPPPPAGMARPGR